MRDPNFYDTHSTSCSVSIRPDILARVGDVRRDEDVSLSFVVEEALELFLATYARDREKKHLGPNPSIIASRMMGMVARHYEFWQRRMRHDFDHGMAAVEELRRNADKTKVHTLSDHLTNNRA